MKAKLCTDINQSKKLAEILPLESADMHFVNDKHAGCVPYLEITNGSNPWLKGTNISPCWSLAALFTVLPNKIVSHETAFEGEDTEGINDIYNKRIEPTEDGRYTCCYVGNGCIYECVTGNPVDACYEMILKLHELNLL